MRKIKAMYFKKSGKYYTDEIIEVPKNLHVFEICDGIKDGTIETGCKSLPYVMIDAIDNNDKIMYPCLIIKGGDVNE